MAQRFGFEKVGRFTKAEGNTVWGWAFVSTIKGEPYFDLGDGVHSDHIPADSIVPVSKMFARASRKGLDMHSGDQVAEVLHTMPITAAIAKATDVVSEKEGLMIGWETDDQELIAKVESGERTGFSIGGIVTAWDIVDELGNVIESVSLDSIDKAKRFGSALKFGKAATGQQLRRIFRLWDLEEISLVDFPMQEPALAALAKSGKRSIQYRKIKTIARAFHKGMLITTEVEGHQHTLDPSATYDNGTGSTSWAKADGEEYGHDHPWIRGDDGEIQILANTGHSHDIDETIAEDTAAESSADLPNVETIYQRRAREVLPNRKQSSSVTSKEHEQMADKDAKDTRIAELETSLAKANRRATLTDAQRAYMKKLPEADHDGFLAKSSADRDAEIRSADAADPIAYTAKSGVFKGRAFRQSESDMATMAKALDDAEERTEKARELAETAEVTAIAKAKMPKMSGKPELHAKMIKALKAGLEKADFDAAIEVLDAANTTIGADMEEPEGTTVDLEDGSATEVPPTPEQKAKGKGTTVEKAREDLDAYVAKMAATPKYQGLAMPTVKARLLRSDPKAKELYNSIANATRN